MPSTRSGWYSSAATCPASDLAPSPVSCQAIHSRSLSMRALLSPPGRARRDPERTCEHDSMTSIAHPASPPAKPRTVPRVARLFRPYRGRVGVLAGVILASAGLGVVNPLLTKVVFDK